MTRSSRDLFDECLRLAAEIDSATEALATLAMSRFMELRAAYPEAARQADEARALCRQVGGVHATKR